MRNDRRIRALFLCRKVWRAGLIFGNIILDTIKEKVYLSNIDPNALPEIETIITSYMMEKKEQLGYERREEKK